MQELREVVRVIERYGIEDGITFDFMGANGKESLVSRLYAGIAEGRYQTDEDAVVELYGRATVHAAYRQLKSRLRRQVLQAILGLEINHPPHTLVAESFYNCTKRAAIARILVVWGARNIGIALAHKTLQEAENAHLFDIVLQCARLLRSHYSLIGLEKQFKEYNQIVEDTIKIQTAEAEADRLIEQFMVKYARSTSKKSEFTELARNAVVRLQELKTEYPTKTAIVSCFRMKSLYCQITSEFSALVAVCDEAELYYVQYPHFSTKIRLAEFALTKMVAFLHLRDYERGEASAQQCLELYPNGSNNWFVLMWYYFLLCLHSQQFVRAVEVFQEVSTHPCLQDGGELRLEKWRVNEGYLHYVVESGWASGEGVNVEIFSKRFNVYKFLNEVPTYSKDKRGMNVSILVLQVLFLVERGEFEKVVEKRETLRRYATRYLLTEDTRRSRVFMKLLLLLEQHHFEHTRVEKAGRRHYALLCRRDGVYGSADDTEIIPFELLWERILLRLR